MKTRITSLVAFSLFALVFNALAQSAPNLHPGYYLVVSAYAPSQEGLAKRYVGILENEGFTVSYGLHSPTNLLLVYLQYADNLRESLLEMHRVRERQRFSDAWVRVVPGDITSTVAAEERQDAQVVTTQDIPDVEQAKIEQAKKETRTPDAGATLETETFPAIYDSIEVTDNDEIVQHKQMTLGNTEVFLSLFHARNNRIVDGDVQVIDTERSKKLVNVKGNEYLLLPDPRSKSGQLTLICEAFGYRKLQYEINYPLPLADTVKPYIDLMGTTLVVNFDLVRYHKGDIATLYNVYFYNDANVMLPESKYELTSLLQMMQEGHQYRIRLHGHSNGNYHGRIIQMGPDRNFFSLDGSTNAIGSAKELSKLRAEIIREYLIENGIAGDRIEIKAWGGKRPLYDKNGPNARRNVRVEVEILDGKPI
jgi:outer membrane protein OmpA-like peptidoglycan-associated protein